MKSRKVGRRRSSRSRRSGRSRRSRRSYTRRSGRSRSFLKLRGGDGGSTELPKGYSYPVVAIPTDDEYSATTVMSVEDYKEQVEDR